MTIPLLIAIPVVAGIITQSIKFVLDLAHRGRSVHSAWTIFWSYGGMPSAHSAFIVSLTTAVGLWEGVMSPIFAVCFVLCVIIIRDAVGIRQALSRHGIVLNRLIRDLPNDRERAYPHLAERLGHTSAEAVVGGLLGIAVSVSAYLVFGP